MTSKEALEKLSCVPIYKEDEHNVITDIDSCCVYQGDLCEVYESEVDTIKKDLDWLEKLEIIVETLKKAFLLGVGELRGVYYVLAHDNNYCMTKEEYDLLKEVLEDD